LVSCALLPAAALVSARPSPVEGPGREAPVLEDSEKLPTWELQMEHRLVYLSLVQQQQSL
jgi:hypothetical protein